MIVDWLSPGLLLALGALIVPLLPLGARKVFLLALPLICIGYLLNIEHGSYGTFTFLGQELVTVRVDQLSFVFGLIFLIAAFIGNLFAMHDDDVVQQACALIYSGSAVGAVFAGDLVTLFVYWELTAISSVFLIWASRNEEAYKTGMRYLIIQVGSGVILLSGLMVHAHETGSIAFSSFLDADDNIAGLGGKLILLAFGIKCAFPFLHNWLQDAYPKATVTGTVILSAFTTKLAVYSLARGYAGFEPLIYVGALMTAFPIFFAVIENDLRKVLAYSLNNQLGFMVCGVGVGTAMALNGTAAHAFSHILYKALLFMSMGAVLYRCGTAKASELGGLHRYMPWTTGFCIIGAMSISAFPLFSGFISKSLILTAAADEGYWFIWAVLLMASAGVMEHSGIKIPFFAFFGEHRYDWKKRLGHQPKEAPFNMLLAMFITAFLCIFIGVFPDYLYAILPYEVDYHPYTTGHVVTQMQLLMFSVLAFVFLMKTGLYPPEIPSLNLDFDVVYRRVLPKFIQALGAQIAEMDKGAREWGIGVIKGVMDKTQRTFNPLGPLGDTGTSGMMAVSVTVMLGVFLLFFFI
ncbi:MAG: Na(+)/H(+) antiporter subunit D [Magnetovibrionaceae bacterium]